MSFHNYAKTLFFWRTDSIKAATNGIYNSFILALLGATIAMILSLVVSHMIHRTKGFGARILDFLAADPQAELSDIRIVHGPDDLHEKIPAFVAAFLKWTWSQSG